MTLITDYKQPPKIDKSWVKCQDGQPTYTDEGVPYSIKEAEQAFIHYRTEARAGNTEIALVGANETQRDLIAKVYSMKQATDPLFKKVVPQFATLETIDACLPLESVVSENHPLRCALKSPIRMSDLFECFRWVSRIEAVSVVK